MTYRLRFLPRAQREIRSEGIYLAERSKRAETRWRNRILLAVKHLELDPTRFPQAHEAVALGIDLREYQIGNKRGSVYRLLFTIDESIVNVLSVRHAAQYWLESDDL